MFNSELCFKHITLVSAFVYQNAVTVYVSTRRVQTPAKATLREMPFLAILKNPSRTRIESCGISLDSEIISY